ncbi:hypothetical protein AN916_08325 [Mycobacteroides immunogenum]|nr:hypothetical protein AN916_07835 [Mycobacteroides immunogenum]KPG55830.1 hypothetical protein AN916_08325 [Mycobacteroides immunogenum]
MDSLSAFARGEASRGNRIRVFDWVRAAEIIRDAKPEYASAGLAMDWEYTGGLIYDDGAPVPIDDTYTYLASTWATPELKIDGDVLDCWTWADESGWDAGTYWPEEALEVLNGGV